MTSEEIQLQEKVEQDVLAYIVWSDTEGFIAGDAIIGKLKPDYFYNPTNKIIFGAILDLKRGSTGGATPTNLMEKVINVPNANSIILGYGTENYSRTPEAQQSNVEILKRLYLKRRAVDIYTRLGSAIQDPTKDVTDTFKEIQGEWTQEEANSVKSDLLKLPTLESLTARDEELRQMGKGDIKTSYYFHNKDNDKEIEQLTLPSGAITLVCALTSHGKSTFLRDIALEVAQNGQKGDTLFYTYESSEQEIEWGFINSYIKQPFNRGNNLNIQTIKDYEQTGKIWFAGDSLQTYLQGKERFRKELLCSGKLRLLRRSNDAAEIQDEIRFYNKFRPIKCVFIDYIQKLHLKDNRLSRTEELSKICSSFEALAIELGLPIVMAAQLNRQTTDPVSMCSQNLAESTSIEQSSAKMVFLWNSTERARVDKESKELKNFAERTGITLGVGGQIYARLEKNRFGIRQAEAVFEYLPNTGDIRQQKPTQQQIADWQSKQGQGTAEPQQNDPLGTPDDTDALAF